MWPYCYRMALRHQHGFRIQHRLQTSAWPSVVTWATDTNRTLSSNWTTNQDMVHGGMDCRDQHGLSRYRPVCVCMCVCDLDNNKHTKSENLDNVGAKKSQWIWNETKQY